MIDALAETIRLANAQFEREIERAELLIRDLGGTEEEIEAAVGPDGFFRKMLQKERDSQVAQVRRWLTLGDDKLH